MIFGGSDADWPRSYFFVGQRSALLMLASPVRSALFRTVDIE
jgi:hypothetical protein